MQRKLIIINNYRGQESILLLFSESNVDLYKLKLSDSSNLVLEKLLSVSFFVSN